MTPSGLAGIEVALLIGGALGARSFTRRIARGGDRRVILMAAVAAWVILFGILPFVVFAIYARTVGPAGGRPVGWEVVVLNLIPFALVTAPFAGFVQGLRLTGRRARP